MRKKIKIRKITPVFLVLMKSFFFFNGCTARESEAIRREDLFALEIGRLEDQVAFYNQNEDSGFRRNDVCMRDGIFYISDGEGQKITRFNSYGDILMMIYNDETNPAPLTLQPKQEGGTTRWAFTYPLREPGRIAVDSRKHIYAEDRLPPERHSFSSENKTLLDGVVLHFNMDGEFLEYLGQEGVGGSPFPLIEGLYTSIDDDVAVVCRIPSGWNVYWFDRDGVLIYLIKIKNESVPIPADRRDVVLASLDTISVSPDERKIYIKVDYYRNTFDSSTNTRSGSESDSSAIWVMRADDGVYEKTIEAPLFETYYTENNRKVAMKIPFALLGIAKNEQVFLTFPEEGGYVLLILDTKGSKGIQHQGIIKVNTDELQFNAFDLSSDGILSAMLISEWEVKLVWWRTDKFVNGDAL